MNVLDRYLQRIWRASLTSTSLLTLDELVEVLPGEPSIARPWAQAHLRAAGQVAGVAVYRWGDVLAATESGPVVERTSRVEPPLACASPIASWQAAAEACGVSPDTLRRRRAEVDDESEPWWATADECRAWFRRLISGPEPAARLRSQPHPPAKKGRTLADRPKRRGRD